MDKAFHPDHYRAVFDIAPLGISVADAKGRILEANRAFLELLGYSLAELQQLRFEELVHPDDRTRLADLVQAVRDGRSEAFEIEKRCRTRDGRWLWTRARAIVQREVDGKIRHWLGFIENITGRRAAEKALSESEQRYRALFEEAGEGILVADAATRFIRYANPAACRMLGHSNSEIRRLRVENLHPPESVPEVLARFEAQGRRQERYAARVPFLRKDGRTIFCSLNSTPMEIDGRPCTVGFLQDVTELLRAEQEQRRLAEQFHQAQKMEAIGTLAGGLAHDFNNLLMGIQGNISLLRLNKEPGNRELAYLDNVEAAVQRASDLTRQLLGFARGGKYEVKATDLNQLLEKTLLLFGRPRKGIIIRQGFQPQPWTVKVDQTQLQQVVLNLLMNAAQAMPGGGTLSLESANVTVGDGHPGKPPDAACGRYVCLTVSDSGVGMDPETQVHIFEPFFTAREPGQGSGLGLAAVFGIVKNHGGFIAVRSQKDHGSSFSVYIPASGATPAAACKAAARTPDLQTVLLVEDEEMVAEVGRQMLQRLGYRTLVARSGAQALTIYEQRHAEIDLVILDMIMPGMGGQAVFERLRAINPQAAVLLSSGYSLNGQAFDLMHSGCWAFIQKPFSIEQLQQKIKEVIA